MTEKLKRDLIAIARKASKTILSIYHDDSIDFQIKGDNSPVTAADLQSQRLITEELKRISSYPVLGEENPIAYEIRKTWSCFWLVDPLDGTKDFLARNDEFTINIALIKDEQPIIGLVGLPAKGLYYFAAKGQGAFRISEGGEELISNTREQKELICLDSRFHSSSETAAFCRNNSITQIERFGSALKFCRLAEGVADIYPRLAPTREWDIAAGHCILQEANCQIIDLETGLPPRYNKQSLLNNHFIALRDGLALDLETLTLS